jgi:siroheme synthase-like protein
MYFRLSVAGQEELMAYFPFFVDLTDRPGLVVGGGVVALRKVEKLLPFGPRLTVAAPDLLPELTAMAGVTCLQVPFTESMLDGCCFVIAATDDRDLNHHVAALCRERHIPVNTVDDKDACTFLFPALVQDGPLTVGISTGGASPSAAIYVKERVRESLPAQFGDILNQLADLREPVRAAFETEHQRADVLATLLAACLAHGGPLPPEKIEKIFREKREAEISE